MPSFSGGVDDMDMGSRKLRFRIILQISAQVAYATVSSL